MVTNVMNSTQCRENLLCGVNVVKDCNDMTDLEKKHQPIITAPKTVRRAEPFEVSVEVGKLLAHPNEPGHYIEFIELYADHTYLLRMDLAARITCPVMKCCICLDHSHGKLRAFAHCNLHGTWEGQSEIEVIE